MNIKLFVFIFVVLCVQINLFAQSNSCYELFNQKTLKNLVKPSKSASKTIRSSAGHFWLVTKDIIEGRIPSHLTKKQKKILKELEQVKGRVFGDFHNGNVGLGRVGVTRVNKIGELDFISLDYDDHAIQGPIIFDIIHHIIAAKSVDIPDSEKLYKQEIFDMYLKGLLSKQIKPSRRMQAMIDMTPEQFRDLEIKKASKFILKGDSDKLIKDGEKSSQLSINEETQVKQIVQQALGHEYEVLDVGGREKESGGSAGELRYLVLVKEVSSGNCFLFELKTDSPSAVDEAYSQIGNSHQDRLAYFVHKGHEVDERYATVIVEKNNVQISMTLRPKPLYFFDSANDGSSINAFKEFKDLTLFNAYWLGAKQIRDDAVVAKKLLKVIKSYGLVDVFESVKALTSILNDIYTQETETFLSSIKAKKNKID